MHTEENTHVSFLLPKYGVGAISAINTYYNRPCIPIGGYKGSFAASENGAYTETLATKFPASVRTLDQVPGALSVYRAALAQAEDASVTIVSVGFFTNILDLVRFVMFLFTPSRLFPPTRFF